MNLSKYQNLLGALLGFWICVLLFGSTILYPTHIDWLLQDSCADCVQHLLGWEFFRFEPWHWPLGTIKNFGAPEGTSIVYTDSLPLFAVFFKVIANFLPEHFQYFGLWFVIAFTLQGYFSWRIANFTTSKLMYKIIFTLFFLLSPTMLNRMIEHQALAGHWVLLAGIFLYLRPFDQYSQRYWLLLNAITLLIHAYLAVLVAGIWIAYLCQHVILTRQLSLKSAVFQFASTSLVLGCLAWLSGYFILPFSAGIATEGYTSNGMNVLAPWQPTVGSTVVSGVWSAFVKPFPVSSPLQTYEGFNYFGLGMIVLLVVGSLDSVVNFKKINKIWFPILIVSMLFSLFALTDAVTLGDLVIFHYTIPSQLHWLTETFRSSGRFFWVMYYLLMVFTLMRLMRVQHVGMLLLLSGALLLQIADLSPKLQAFQQFRHQVLSSDKWNTEFFHYVAGHYRHLVFYPIVEAPHVSTNEFKNFSQFAALHHMSTNNGYFARFDAQALALKQADLTASLSMHQFDPESLYVFSDVRALLQIAHNAPKQFVVYRFHQSFLLLPTPLALAIQDEAVHRFLA